MSTSKIAVCLFACSLLSQTACVSQTDLLGRDPAAVSMPPASSTPEKYHDQVSIAIQACEEGNLDRGKDLLQKIVVADPTSAEADLCSGIIANLDKQYQAAIKYFDSALAKNPRLEVAYHERGNAYRNLKDYDKAISDLSTAMLLGPHTSHWVERARAYAASKKDYEKALLDANTAISKEKNYDAAYEIRAEIEEAMGNYKQARLDYDKGLELTASKNRPLYLYCRGNFFMRINEFALAQADYLAAAKESAASDERTTYDGRYNYLASLADMKLHQFDKAKANLDIFSQKSREAGISKNVKLAEIQYELLRRARYDWEHRAKTPAQQWAIACSSQLFKQNQVGIHSLAGEELTADIIAREKTTLREWWSDNSREDLLATLDYQLKTGHSGLWRQTEEMSKQPSGKLLSLAADQLNNQTGVRLMLVQKYGEKFGPRALKAWDLCRYICLCRWGYKVGWLTEAECYERMMPVAKQLQQMYGSWKEMGEAYLVGRQFWSNSIYQKDKERSEKILHELLTDSDSPWVTLPWNTELK